MGLKYAKDLRITVKDKSGNSTTTEGGKKVSSTSSRSKTTSKPKSGVTIVADKNAAALAKYGSSEAQAFNQQQIDAARQTAIDAVLRSLPTSNADFTAPNNAGFNPGVDRTQYLGNQLSPTTEQPGAVDPNKYGLGSISAEDPNTIQAISEWMQRNSPILQMLGLGNGQPSYTPSMEDPGDVGGAVAGMVGGTGGKGVMKFFTGNKPNPALFPGSVIAARNAAQRVSLNSKTWQFMKDHAKGVLAGLGFVGVAASLVTGLLVSRGTSYFVGQEEAPQAAGMGAYIAISNNNPELALQVIEDSREILNNSDVHEGFWSWVPGSNVKDSVTKEFLPIWNIQMDAMEQVARDQLEEMNNTGGTGGLETLSQYQAKLDAKAENEARIAEENLRLYEIQLRLKNEAEAANRKEEAAYWDDQLKKRKAYEAELLKMQQEYWKWYYEFSMAAKDRNAPSALGFGLL